MPGCASFASSSFLLLTRVEQAKSSLATGLKNRVHFNNREPVRFGVVRQHREHFGERRGSTRPSVLFWNRGPHPSASAWSASIFWRPRQLTTPPRLPAPGAWQGKARQGDVHWLGGGRLTPMSGAIEPFAAQSSGCRWPPGGKRWGGVLGRGSLLEPGRPCDCAVSHERRNRRNPSLPVERMPVAARWGFAPSRIPIGRSEFCPKTPGQVVSLRTRHPA